jgi:hypothetical protein
VETARCTVPASSRNGCSSAGRGPENSRSHAPEPIPATQASGASGTRNPTARCKPGPVGEQVPDGLLPAGSMVSTRNIAAAGERGEHRLRLRLGQRAGDRGNL